MPKRSICATTAVVLSVVLVGCTGGLPSLSGDATTTTVETPPCMNAGFYGITAGYYSPKDIMVGYKLEPGESGIVTIIENQTVLGAKYVPPAESVSYVDGDTISFFEPLSGSHTIRIVIYNDTNGNSEFDPAVDEKCKIDGEVVSSEPITLNFTTTTTPS